MKDAVTTKMKLGRPVAFTTAEADYLVEVLREAVATTLEVPTQEITDDARIFEDLGLDSIDVFDVLDQLTERFEVPGLMEQMPETVLQGDPQATFRSFAEGLLRHFGQVAA